MVKYLFIVALICLAGLVGGVLWMHSSRPLSVPAGGLAASDATRNSTLLMPRLSKAQETVAPAPQDVAFTEVPPLEATRTLKETDGQEGAATTLSADFPCGFAPNALRVSDSHFRIDLQNKSEYMFLFRLDNVRGKTIRIDVKGIPLRKWCTVNPVYKYESMTLPALIESSGNGVKQEGETAAHNGSVLPPDGQSQEWRFVSDVWAERNTTLSFVQTFNENSVYVAMKPPFTPQNQEELVERVRNAAGVHVLEVGKSSDGQPLIIIEVSGDDTAERTNPCVLMYAREHADENESSWPIAGAVQWFAEGSAPSQELRKRMTFLFIPVLDPDAASKTIHESVIETFNWHAFTPESVAYANFFKKWVDSGNRLDVVLSMHNLESAEGQQLECPLIPPTADAHYRDSLDFFESIRTFASNDRYLLRSQPWHQGVQTSRLGGWLMENYGPTFLPFECNGQCPLRHLTDQELMTMGSDMLQGLSSRLTGDGSKDYLNRIDAFRAAYATRWKTYGRDNNPGNALVAESSVRTSAGQ